MASRDPTFRFWRFIEADLRRACEVQRKAQPRSWWRLAPGLLSPRFMPVLLCRIAYWFYCLRLMPLAKLVSLLNFMIFGIEISFRCHIGPGLYFPHTQGTVIGAWRIGDNATIYQGVTLGARELDLEYDEQSRPVLGNNVIIGSGAKVLGHVVIGNHAKVGANAVVIQSIPDGATAVGPVAIIKIK